VTYAFAPFTVIAIFAAFFALYGALGTESNQDEIGSLQWEVSRSSDAIDSLRRDVEQLKSALGR
jgi:hypothetical protein